MKTSKHIESLVRSLDNKDLSPADRSLLISAVLSKLAAVPLRDIIRFDAKGKLFVNDKEASVEEMNALRSSAMQLLDNRAFKLIREQVVYATFVQSAHKSANIEELIFGKAALWWGQQEDKYLKLLSAEDRNGNSPN